MTTVYKADLSTVGDLYNLVTKIITKYPVKATFKILKITKKTPPIFFVILRILKVARTGYFVMIFVTRLYKSPTLLKPALYTVVHFQKNFPSFKKIFTKNFQNFAHLLGNVPPPTFNFLFQNLKIAKSI